MTQSTGCRASPRRLVRRTCAAVVAVALPPPPPPPPPGMTSGMTRSRLSGMLGMGDRST